MRSPSAGASHWTVRGACRRSEGGRDRCLSRPFGVSCAAKARHLKKTLIASEQDSRRWRGSGALEDPSTSTDPRRLCSSTNLGQNQHDAHPRLVSARQPLFRQNTAWPLEDADLPRRAAHDRIVAPFVPRCPINGNCLHRLGRAMPGTTLIRDIVILDNLAATGQACAQRHPRCRGPICSSAAYSPDSQSDRDDVRQTEDPAAQSDERSVDAT